MAEKIISEYEVITQKAVSNLQAVVNEYGKVDEANKKSTNQFLVNAGTVNAQLAKQATQLTVLTSEANKSGLSFAKMGQLASGATLNIGNLETTLKALYQDLKGVEIGTSAFSKLTAQIQLVEQALKKTSSTTKPFIQQSTSGFNGLSNSINQITRELPAFTFSAQTGFLALSNNIPILVDNIDNLRRKNAELIAQGQPVQSVFKQIVGSLFSFQTAISLGVTLFTIYGREIGNFISSLFKGNEAISEAKMRLDALNSAYDSKELKSGVKSLIELRSNIELAKNGFVSKEVVLKQYNETLGLSFGKVNDLDSAEKAIISNTPIYINALVQRAAANKILDDVATTSIEIAKETEKFRQESFERTRLGLNELNRDLNRNFISQEVYNQKVAKLFEENNLETAKKRNLFNTKEINDLEKKQQEQLKLFTQFNAQSAKVLGNEQQQGGLKSAFQILQEELSKTEDAFKSAKLKGVDTTEIEARFKKLTAEVKAVSDAFDELTGEAAKRREKELEATIKAAIDEAEDYSKEVNRIAEIDMKTEKERRKELERLDKEDTKNNDERLKQNLSNELLANDKLFFSLRQGKELSRKDSLMLEQEELKAKIDILKRYQDADDSTKKELLKAEEQFEKNKTELTKEGEKERSQLREQVLQGAFSLAQSFEQGLFDLKQANLRAETDAEISTYEDQRDKKLITEEQFKQKRAQALNEQAQKQRELDLSQIKIQTALAVIRAIAQSPQTFGLPFSAFALAEGAVQYAFASAQPLPRFAQGTERVRGGIKGQDSVHALLMPDEAVIKANENMKYDGMAKAWNAGNLDGYIMQRFVNPAIEQANREWAKMQVNQNSTFIRNDNFNDKRIVKGLDRLNKKIGAKEKVIYKRSSRLWN